MRLPHIVIGLAFVALGGVGYAQTQSASPHVFPSPVESITAQEKAFLMEAVAETPFSALVVHSSVTIQPEPKKKRSRGELPVVTEERHIYQARVLEVFRGKPTTSVRYEMVVESGETSGLSSKPQIVTLCSGPRGLYWPGPGAIFSATQEAVAVARVAGRQAASPEKFPQCD